jgi:hypothetical protein
MSSILNKLKGLILNSPLFKTLIFGISTILSGVLASAFVVEISPSSELKWETFYRTRSFYGLVGLLILLYVYNRAAYAYEINMLRFQDRDYCIAYIRSKCLPELAERTRRNIREGTGGELKDAMDELRKVLK